MIQPGSDGPRDGVSFRYRGSVYVRRAQFQDWLVEHGYPTTPQQSAEILRDLGLYQYTFKYMPLEGDATSISLYRSKSDTLLDGLPEWPGPRMARPGEADPEPVAEPLAPDQRPIDAPARLPANLRLAVEKHAEDRVIEHYEGDGWTVTRVSHQKLGWDLTAMRDEAVRHIEVKGSTGPAVAIELTPNELEKAREYPDRAVLAIVSAIKLDADGIASGGDVEVLEPWEPAGADLTVTRYSYRPPPDERITV